MIANRIRKFIPSIFKKERQSNLMMISGATNCGSSMFTESIAKIAIENGQAVFYVSCNRRTPFAWLLGSKLKKDRLKQAYSWEPSIFSASACGILKRANSIPNLGMIIIDGLDQMIVTRKTTNWYSKLVGELSRYARKNNITIITSQQIHRIRSQGAKLKMSDWEISRDVDSAFGVKTVDNRMEVKCLKRRDGLSGDSLRLSVPTLAKFVGR